MARSSPVLGVEGDGSHSHAVVTDSSGALLGLGANDDPSNWDDVGIAAAAAALRSCVGEALEGAGVAPHDVEASVFALAGVDFPVDEQRLAGIPEAFGLDARCRIENDGFAALRAGTDQSFGVVVIAGNGSVVAGRNPAGDVYRSLGLGTLYGDFGSETDVSQSAVTAIADAFIGRGPPTVLTERVCAFAGVESVIEFLDGTARARIDTAAFGPIVIAAAEEGDAVAGGLLSRAGTMLGRTTAHVIRTLGLEEIEFEVVLARSMFDTDTSLLVDALEGCVRPVAPNARMRRLEAAPVVGSALLAVELAGETPAERSRATLADAVTSALGLPAR
jgi:N-acetylglucosamine kinase-like BadF-type ATPase